ncbi:MAG TPA: hypothetical protein VGF74_03735 [Thermoleophilaceae bacterium]
MNSLFCRHNRFTADCPICSKGTVLDSSKPAPRPRSARQSSGGGRRGGTVASRVVTGPYASAGPYEDEAGDSYDVRLERVPGGVRLAEWASGQIRRRAPVLAREGLAQLVASVGQRDILPAADAEKLAAAASAGPDGDQAAHGASRGRAGDMQEELRVERLEEGRLRIARWILRPGAGWELQEAPVMLPAARYAEAIRAAAGAGVLAD